MAALRFFSGAAYLKAPVNLFLGSSARRLTEFQNLKNGVVFRNMGHHKRTIENIPTSFDWRQFKDHAHFYVMLGVVPIGLIILGTNIFIGPAELADIPEGYEPKHWEYYKHPISRFIARYILESPEHKYERHLHFLAQEQAVIEMRKLDKKVNKLLDAPSVVAYRKWYYVPRSDKYTKIAKDGQVEHEETRTFSG